MDARLCALVVFFVLADVSVLNLEAADVDYFHFRSDTELHRLAADPTTGALYVGATNRLYMIDPSTSSGGNERPEVNEARRNRLRLMETVSIGPRPDHELCTEKFGEEPCGGGQAKIQFVRENGKVVQMNLMPPGMSFVGVKQ